LKQAFLLTLLLFGTGSACSLARQLCPYPTPAPQPVCRLTPPPKPEPVTVAGPDEGCPSSFVGCLDVDGGLALERRLRASQRWEAEAWALCGTDGG